MTLDDILPAGEPVVTGTYEFTAQRIIEFAGTFDPHFFHLDAEKAKTSLFGGLCASGWHVCAAAQKCTIDYLGRQAGLGSTPEIPASDIGTIRNLKWLRPVFAGETVTFMIRRGTGAPGIDDPETQTVEVTYEGTNQDGITVIRFEASIPPSER